MVATIYQIVCLVNGYSYIGSSKNYKHRVWKHLYDLRKGKHHSVVLQRCYTKYGEQALMFEPLEVCIVDNQLMVEQKWINEFKPRLNISKIAGRPGNPNKIKSSKAGKIGGITNKKSGQWDSIARLGQIAGGIATGKIMGQLAREGKSQQYKDFQAKAWANCSKDFIVIEPSGKEYLITNLRGFCKDKELTYSCLLRVADLERAHHKKWRAYKCCHLK